MKKIKFKLNLKKYAHSSEKSDWQRSLFFVASVSVFVFIGVILYLIIKPVPQVIKDQVDTEISNTQIKLDIKTLEKIKNKEY